MGRHIPILAYIREYPPGSVHVSRDVSWSSHVDVIVNKAKKVVGLLKPTVGSKNGEIFSMFRKSLVRPLLQYACLVWSPYLVKDKMAIEKVKRRASRIARGQKPREMSYEERCILLNWNTLQHRREYLSVVECYKTVFILNGLDFNDYFEFCRSKNTGTNHPYKIQTKLAKVNSFKYSFFLRIVKDWNSLPNHLFTDEINSNKFKKRLKKMDEDLLTQYTTGTQPQFSNNICWEDDLRCRIFGTFFVKFLACLPLLGFSTSKNWYNCPFFRGTQGQFSEKYLFGRRFEI